jgi:hypothetical protein
MSGILDPKSRIMDTVITDNGRRQLASGQMRIEYATFTDIGSFYESEAGILADPTSGRLYFEPPSDLPSDLITYETDDSGILAPYRSNGLGVYGRNVVASSAITGSNIIENSILESFGHLQVIGTQDPLDDSSDFRLTRDQVVFTVKDFPNSVADIDVIETLAHDHRLSNLPNFKYLPPVNHIGQLAGQPIADYENLNEEFDMDPVARDERLKGLDSTTILFDETSIDNNFIMQAFETLYDGANVSSLTKLDIIDGGFEPSREDPARQRRFLYLGKIMFDNFQNPTFVNMFTIELE